MIGTVQCTFTEPITCHSSYLLSHITPFFSFFPFFQTVSPTIPFHYLFLNGLLYNPILFPNYLEQLTPSITFFHLSLTLSTTFPFFHTVSTIPYHCLFHLSLICYPLPTFPFPPLPCIFVLIFTFLLFYFFRVSSRIFPFSPVVSLISFFPVVSLSFLFPNSLRIFPFSPTVSPTTPYFSFLKLTYNTSFESLSITFSLTSYIQQIISCNPYRSPGAANMVPT
jgi:hypothetical protein